MIDDLLSYRITDGGLELTWAMGPVVLPWFWLRDHCQAPETIRPDTKQRQLDTFSIPPNIKASSLGLDPSSGDLVVTWDGDDQVSSYPIQFLFEATTAPTSIGEPDRKTELWHSPIEAPTVAYADIVGELSDEHIDVWVQAVAERGFCLVESVPADEASTEALAKRLGYIRETIYGGMWRTEADLKHHDTGHTNESLGSHTDGTYSHDAPGLLLFHVTHFDGEGGDSTLVDGFAIADHLRLTDPEAFEVLTRVLVPGHYLEPGVHLRAERPVIRLDQTGAVEQISFNNYDRAPFVPPTADVDAFYRALGRFKALADDPDRQWRHRLLPGTTLLFDNWRMLHGRYGYVGHRVLIGCYFNHEDFESRLRIAAVAKTNTSSGRSPKLERTPKAF